MHTNIRGCLQNIKKTRRKGEYPNNNFVQNIRHNSQLTLIKVTNSIHKHLNIIIYAYLHMQMAPG